MSGFPSFEKNEFSPPLPGDGSGITIAPVQPSPSGTIVHGSFRVTAADRARLAPGPLRPRVWLFVLSRDGDGAWIGRPGGEAVVFEGEEPDQGTVEGWFHVELEECCRVRPLRRSVLDLVAVLGPWRSAPREMRNFPQ